MLNELETAQLAALLDAYGLKGVVDALATEADRRCVEPDSPTEGFAWGYNMKVLRRTVTLLWPLGKED